MAKRSNKTIGSDGERAALEDLRPAFPDAERVKRADYGIEDCDLVLDSETACEVKTGENYLSKGYQKHLDQSAKYEDIRPGIKYSFAFIQDRPGRGRPRTKHVVWEAQVFIDREVERNLRDAAKDKLLEEYRKQVGKLKADIELMGGRAGLIAAKAVARDRESQEASSD